MLQWGHNGYTDLDWPSPFWRNIINTFTVAAESSEPVLAVLGTEIKDFDLESMNPDETSERFQCLVGQFNYLEIVHYMESGKSDTWIVTNREFIIGQVIDMGIEFGDMTSQAMHVYNTCEDAQRCVLATVACYLGQPDMIVGLVNE